MQQPIDFVIIWVDGGDPAWQAEKNQYLEQETGKKVQVDASDIRYRDWDLLRYWFRAVETYAPWVNKIHFVTCGQVPDWLNLDHPKLNFVQHKDYIPAEYLPTFSSHPIELNLHRIPGLSEQFVYFNDDFFLTAPVKPEDFFRNGLPCDRLKEEPLMFRRRTLYNYIRVNNMVFANTHFKRMDVRRKHWQKWFPLHLPKICIKNLIMVFMGRKNYFFGFAVRHLPQPYLKSTLEQVWAAEPNWLHETCTHRFRSDKDISQYVFRFWQLLTGRFYPQFHPKEGRMFSGSAGANKIAKAITGKVYKMICINDSDWNDFEYAKQTINAAFEQTLSQKSLFEK